MKHMITVLLIIIGLINFAPVTGAFSAEQLTRLYGLEFVGSDLLILMRHRAILFGILGAYILIAAFRSGMQLSAMIMAGISLIGFIVLALMYGEYGEAVGRVMWIDVVAVALLAIAAILRWIQGNKEQATGDGH